MLQDDVVKAAEEWLFDGHGRRSLSVMIFGGPGAGAGAGAGAGPGAGGEGKGHVAEMEPYMQQADSGTAVEPDGPFFGPTVTKVGVDGLQTLRDALPLFTPGPVDDSGSGSDGTAASLTIR